MIKATGDDAVSDKQIFLEMLNNAHILYDEESDEFTHDVEVTGDEATCLFLFSATDEKLLGIHPKPRFYSD